MVGGRGASVKCEPAIATRKGGNSDAVCVRREPSSKGVIAEPTLGGSSAMRVRAVECA